MRVVLKDDVDENYEIETPTYRNLIDANTASARNSLPLTVDPRGPTVLREILKQTERVHEPIAAKVLDGRVDAAAAFDTISVSTGGEFQYSRDGNIVRDALTPLNAKLIVMLIGQGIHVNSSYPVDKGSPYDEDHALAIRLAYSLCELHGPAFFYNLLRCPAEPLVDTDFYHNKDDDEEIGGERGRRRTKVETMYYGFPSDRPDTTNVFRVRLTTIAKEGEYDVKLVSVYQRGKIHDELWPIERTTSS